MNTVQEELNAFWRRFGAMIRTGVPLLRALDILAEECRHSRLATAIRETRAAIEAGSDLHTSFERYPEFFSPCVRTIIQTAERMGRLEYVCDEIAAGIQSGFFATAPSTSETASAPEDQQLRANAIVDSIIHEAYKQNVSEIYLEPSGDKLCVRFRVNGVCTEHRRISAAESPAILAQIKLRAGIPPGGSALFSAGRIHVLQDTTALELRIFSVRYVAGEAIAMELNYPATTPLPLEQQGFTAQQLERIEKWLARPRGLIILAGPDGCGKTTTLYSMIQRLNHTEVRIATVETFVRRILPGINQQEVRLTAGQSFADAVQKLLTMGVPAFLLNTALIGVLAQRLVRVLCHDCRQATVLPEWHRQGLRGWEHTTFYRSSGCPRCRHTGYQGRSAIHELLEMTDELRSALRSARSTTEIRALALSSGMVPLREDGLAKAAAGLTTVEEVLGLTYRD
ncbi:MAG: ATPase, T2SS/T4P/T4SS family [Kiritimatiellia bacterium]